MEAIPKSDIKTVIKSDIRFDISIKQTTWIGHEAAEILRPRKSLLSTVKIYRKLKHTIGMITFRNTVL
jgi:hypothetical protein